MPDYTRVDEVVRDDLCHRCGICGGICPVDAVSFNDSALPVISETCTNCGLCAKVCSGRGFDLDGRMREMTGAGLMDTELGSVKGCFLCAASDSDTRHAGASGGVVTAVLVDMLESGIIDGAVVVDGAGPAGRPAAVIADTADKIRQCASSRYSLFPWGMIIGELKKRAGRYAVVGLPCQLQSLFMAMQQDKELADKVVFTVGLFCRMNLEPEAAAHLLRLKGVETEALKQLRYRHGRWPGGIQAELADSGSVRIFDASLNEGCQSVSCLKWAYGQERCLMCPDPLNVLADMSVGDPWVRGKNGRFICDGTEGSTVVLARSEQANSRLNDMLGRGVLSSEENLSELLMNDLKRRFRIDLETAMAEACRKAENCRPDYGLDAAEFRCRSGRSSFERRLFDLLHGKVWRGIYMVLVFSLPGRLFLKLNILRKRLCGSRRI